MTEVAQVKRGIELLDRKGPEKWWDRIKIDRLHMDMGSSCVLGQTFGDYEGGLKQMFGNVSDRTGVRYGFYESDNATNGEGGMPTYEQLHDAWVEEIRFRQLVGSVGLSEALVQMPQMAATEEEAEMLEGALA